LGQTILWETFTLAEGTGVPGWDLLGQPTVAVKADPVRDKYVELSAPGREGQHGLSRRLPAAEIAGRVLRLQFKMLRRNGVLAEPSSLPQLRVEWRDPEGKSGGAVVRGPAYPSPGWEICEGYAAVPAEVREVTLGVTVEGTGGSGGLDDILVERLDPLVESRVAGTVGTRGNLIDGGDFEVGQRNFSVSGDRRIPGRSLMRAVSQAWTIDESTAAVGTRSLRIPLDQDEFRVAFGWVRVQPGKDYVVSLYARSNTKLVLRIGIVEYPAVFRFEYFPISDQFRRERLTVSVRPDVPWSAVAVAIRPSDRPKDAYTKSPTSFVWIDGVSLTPGEPKTAYDPPAPVEVGILGPDHDPADIANLVQAGQSAELTVRAANYQTLPFEGQLAVDLVDALDRPVVPSQTHPLRVDPGRTAERKVGPYPLERGYYKLLATVWPGRIGEGQPLSMSERAFAVVNLADPIPTGNYFGMTVENPRMSRRISQLGAGWVWLRASRPWCETLAGEADWTWYQELLGRAREQRLEVLSDLAWEEGQPQPPHGGDDWRKTCYLFAQANMGKADGIGILDQPNGIGLTPTKYVELVEQASAEIRRVSDKVAVMACARAGPSGESFSWLREAMKGGLDRSGDGLAFRFPPTPLPEEIEPMLDEVRSWRKTYRFKQYIDTGVGARGPSAYLHVPNLYGYQPTEVERSPDVSDPVLHASRLVRALAIRQFAMIDRAAWWVESYRPPDVLRPTIDPHCHEYDNTPRPNLVAFDFATEMLNAAALTEWIDLPYQMRALCFDQTNGDMVVLVWRPFGRSLGSVVLRGLAGRVKVFDLFGRHEVHPTQGGDLVLMVNELVRYVLVPASVKPQVLDVLRHPVHAASPSPPPVSG